MKPETCDRKFFIVPILILFHLAIIDYSAICQGLTGESSEEFGRISEEEAELTSCLTILARTCEKKGDIESAIKYYQRLSRILKADAETLEALGACYMRQGKVDEAYVFFEAAYKACRQDDYRKGEIGKKWLKALLSSQDKDILKERWASWREQYRLPDDEGGIKGLVNVLEGFSDWEHALEISDCALKDKPHSVPLLKERVEILSRAGRREEAISLCDSILSARGEARERLEVLTKLAGITRNMDRSQQEKTLKALGEDLVFSKAIFLHVMGETEDAIGIMEDLEDSGNNIRNYILGFLYKDTGRSSQAIEAFERYLEEEKDDEVRWITGRIHWDMGEKEKAIRCWNKIDDMTDAGFIFRQYGELDRAARLLRNKARKDPDSFWHKMNYAYLLYETGKKEEALENYFSAFPDLWAGGSCYLNQLSERGYYTVNKNGTIEETERFFLEVLAEDPGKVWVRMALGLLYLRDGKVEEARNEFGSIVRESKDKKATVFAMEKTAFCLFLEGKKDETINAYEELIKEGDLGKGRSAEIYLTLGLICQFATTPDYKRAIEYYKNSLDVSPESWTAEHVLYRTGQCYGLMGEEYHRKALDTFESLLAKHKRSVYANSVGIKTGILEKCSPEEIDAYWKAEKSCLSGDWHAATGIFEKLASLSGTGFAAEASLFELYHIYKRILNDEEKARHVRNRLLETFPDGIPSGGLREEEEESKKADCFLNDFEIISCAGTEGTFFPLQTQSRFSQSSWASFLFFKTEDIFPRPEIIVEWYTPFNELYMRSKLSEWYTKTNCWGMYIMDYLPGIIAGPWHVKVFFDGIPVDDIPFSIENCRKQ